MIRKRPASHNEDNDGSNSEALCRELVQCGTQTGVVSALSALHHAGNLRCFNFKPRQLAKKLTKAKQYHADHITAYGRVAQVLDFETESLPRW